MLSDFLMRRNRRTSLSLLLGSMLALSLLLAACGGESGTASTTPTPITPGVLTVGSDTTYPPQEYIDSSTNAPAGFDVDLITAIAQKMGLQAKIVTTKFDTILDDLAAKQFDVVISAVTVTSTRQKQVDFVPYLTAGQSLLVQKGNPEHIQSTDDLCGKAVGVEAGTLEAGVLRTSSDNCEEQDEQPITITALDDQTAVVQLLADHQVVATYQDSPVTDYYIQQHPDQFEAGSPVDFPAPEGIAVRKGDTAMLNAVQAAFNALKTDGTYHQLIVKWGLTTGELTAIDRRFNDL